MSRESARLDQAGGGQAVQRGQQQGGAQVRAFSVVAGRADQRTEQLLQLLPAALMDVGQLLIDCGPRHEGEPYFAFPHPSCVQRQQLLGQSAQRRRGCETGQGRFATGLERAGRLIERGNQHRLLGRKVVLDGATGDAGRRGHLAHADGVEASVDDEIDDRVGQALPGRSHQLIIQSYGILIIVSYVRMSSIRCLSRACLATCCFALALGVAGVAGNVAVREGLSGTAAKAVPALVVSGIAVPLVVLLRHRLDRRSLTSLGARRPASTFLGLTIVLGAGGLVFGVAALAGGIEIASVDWSELGPFLIINTVLALLLEALPEELTFRGYVFTALTDRWRSLLAAILTTTLFVAAPGLSNVISWLLGRAVGVPVERPTFAPGGGDPVAYAILLTVFSAMLITVRLASGSIWAAAGAHLGFLTLNRILFPTTSFHTGVAVVASPGAELLVLLYLLVTIAAGLVASRARHRAIRRNA